MPPVKSSFAESAARDHAPGQYHRHPGTHPTAKAEVHCFSILADLDPGLLPRLIEAFAKIGLWPSKFYSQAIATDFPGQPAEAMIDIQIAGLDCATCDHIAMQFRGMVGVQSVLTSVRASGD